ncbi:MAG: sulfite exporter TauE/SafE family protein [Candidatus Blackburnbacteria bacterium]|nr:sulfite exporter TauE/SafE family protein [Candidatus Blackburnbacteria bacterium]
MTVAFRIMDIWIPLITGLTVGGFSCAAVQGGLLASVVAARQGKKAFLPTVAFLVSKLAAYTLLGFLLGMFGSALSLSDGMRTVMQAVAGLYMLAVAANLLKLHPIFRYAIIQPPKFLTRMVRKEARSSSLFAPAFLGVLTVFIPCGTTLAMETFAISTGNAFLGAATMALFTIGTMPLFAGVGALAAMGKLFEKYFAPVAAAALIFLGISAINSSLVLSGLPFNLNGVGQTFEALAQVVRNPAGDILGAANTVTVVNGVQNANITALAGGYSPSVIEVKAGRPVKLNVTPTGALGCTSVFVIPQLKMSKRLNLGETATFEFTPDKPGNIIWACGMGMYTGTIKVS